ncbi:hypothetical protein PJ985_10400 [Streptomyces sp. ACA25]|uniref:hypothetical protein n=1 Tax=Streptomyces sp. ACA25 TaxID=3022596 RepID=UPI0023076093|nr:hypothetical protein [Streptomyces sp. ACA25]MDB1087976.1 hypothetical protein [Streptomyces sp. ACA25]
MNSPPAAYRVEAVAYCGTPEPCMFHLGDRFSTEAGEARQWAGERATQIAASLGPEDPGTAARFLAWAHDVATARTHHLLLAGQAVIYSCAGDDCLWELSLRPLPQYPTPLQEPGQA